VTSGYQPLGGVLVGSAVRGALEADSSFVLRHGYTYSGHPVAAAAALANLDIIEREQLIERAATIGALLGKGLGSLVDGTHVREARGTMGIWALGLGDAIPAPELRDRLLEHGVIARPIGTTALAYCPPLVVTDEQLEQCVEATRQALSAMGA
jgi:putrescine aminotransferase